MKATHYIAERRYVRKNGEVFWTQISMSMVRDPQGQPLYLVGLINDIDAQKRAAEKLAAQDAEHRQQLEQRIAERTAELNQANDLLREKAAQDAVTSERTRLARDLHDAVTQTLVLGQPHRRGAARSVGHESRRRRASGWKNCANSRAARWPRCARCW